MQVWDIWYPKGGAQGLHVARASIEPHDAVWLHAAPNTLRVEVRDENGISLAFGDRLERDGKYLPMTKLTRTNIAITREDRWPIADDIGALVILPGGEAGILKAWWNAGDGTEWRWSVEFYNRRA